jgi:hypothetical protein
VAAIGLAFTLNHILLRNGGGLVEDPAFHTEHPNYRPGGEQCDPERLEQITSRRQREIQTAECADQANENSRQQSDLVQQWRSANAAEEVVALSRNQLRASIIEATIVFLALCAAAWAAWEARRAARAAERGLRQDAAQSRVELRPYVSVSEIAVQPHFQPDDENLIRQLDLSILWKNNGVMPARKVVTVVNSKWFGPEGMPTEYDFPDLKVPEIENLSHIGPGAEIETVACRLPTDKLVQLINGGYSLHIWGWCEYQDAFKETPRYRTEQSSKVIFMGDVLKRDSYGIRTEHTSKHNAVDEDCFRAASAKK